MSVSMRTRGLLLAAIALAACDDKPAPTSAATASAATEGATASATAAPAPAPTPTAAASIPMPPRPVPIGSSGPIQPSAPPEVQMQAIAYTLALVTPQGMDPLTVDSGYLEDTLKKLEVAVRGVDKGTTPANPSKAAKGNRKIEVEMGHGCADYVPSQLLKRAGTTLKAAYDAGVLVIACHDDKWECHQSTRDPKDVLCHAAPGAVGPRNRKR
jgi:hypothetical protein